MSQTPEATLLGRLAVHYKLITPDQLADATRLQARQGGLPPLGDIFVERGWISATQLVRLLAVQREVLAKSAAATAAPTQAPAEVVPVATPVATPRAGSGPLPVAPSARAADARDPRDRRIDRLLRYGVDRNASDVHLHTGLPVRLRRHGRLEEAEGEPLGGELIDALLREVLDEHCRRDLVERGQTDFAHEIATVARFRGNAFRRQGGTDVIFRIIPPQPPTLDDLGLPADLARLTNFAQGLVLITGPAGCGKSSTLAALLRLINEERREHIISIEDPIEFLHAPVRCVVNQRQAGRDTAGFVRALRAALREDPDVIAIGELRDLETISLALTAAETGHLVLATLHTGSAIRTIDRLVGAFPPSQQPQIRAMVSESLRAVVSQRLVRRSDGSGRVAALEILVATRAVANLIRENKTFQLRSLIQTGSSLGMCLLDQSLVALVRTGQISREDALVHCEDTRLFAS